eukprot:TRINITY_DN8046_c0_g1_i1.p1 TRINITY_DN8046_c0_g1~~TRINITY_DN8046_c0_g1_i1.p1  ORF type:complete len:495 (+),score=157.36 TRINITY_DN8046_c0_g1_i1:204-1688(+)
MSRLFSDSNCDISECPEMGRYLTVSKDLMPGEPIFNDAPAALGPDYSSLPSCLGCHRRVDGSVRCRGCGWPLCSKDCSRSPLHATECRVLGESRRKHVIKDFSSPSRLYDTILPLRTLLLKSRDPPLYAQIIRLMDHNEAPMDPSSASLRSFISDFLLTDLGLPFSSSEVNRILGILCINSFILQEEEGNALAGIYPLASLLSHGCVPNTKIITGEDYSYALEALSPIPAGAMLSFNYTHYTYHLLGTRQRRSELKDTWSFDCVCGLCADPTEGKAYLSALVCRACKAGRVLCNEPLDPSSHWTCDSCRSSISPEAVEFKLSELRSRIQSASGDPIALEKLLSRLPYSLSENHYLILESKRNLLESPPGGSSPALASQEELQRRIGHCEHLLRVIALLFPGRSELRGVFLYEKTLAEYRLVHANWLRMKLGNRGYVERLRDLAGAFEEVILTFKGIKASFFEGKLCHSARTGLGKIQVDIERFSNALDWTSKRL